MNFNPEIKPVLNKKELDEIKKAINEIQVSEAIENYIIELVFATRNLRSYGISDKADYVQYGVSPRAGIALHRASKALAFLKKRDYVLPEDIKELAPDIFNHRIILNYEAEADGVTTQDITASILQKVAIPL